MPKYKTGDILKVDYPLPNKLGYILLTKVDKTSYHFLMLKEGSTGKTLLAALDNNTWVSLHA
jgi:hypothetical protein